MKLPDSPHTIKGDEMDPFSHLPRITQSDLLQRAVAFADQMVRDLEGFDHNLPIFGLTQGERQKLADTTHATYPTPEDMRSRFLEIFLSYMQERYTVISDS